MSKRYVCAVISLAVYFLLFSVPLSAERVSKREKLPAFLCSGLDYLLTLSDTDKRLPFEIQRINDVLDFIASPKQETTLYFTDKILDTSSVYYEFDLDVGLKHVLQYAYNPDIPSYVVAPSSIRLSYWPERENGKKSIPQLWNLLPHMERPFISTGIEHESTTPDTSTGAYYVYDSKRTLILCRYKGRNLLISLTKQKDISDVGRKGFIVGADEDWNYLYTGEKGVSLRGLGWVNSYLYDSFSIIVFYELDKGSQRSRCAVFKWLKAGWAGLNVVKKEHIHEGMKRYAKTFKDIIESPFLPEVERLESVIKRLNGLSVDELRERMEHYLQNLEKRYSSDKVMKRKGIQSSLKNGMYLRYMTKVEMRAIMILESMKYALGKNQLIDKALLFHAK